MEERDRMAVKAVIQCSDGVYEGHDIREVINITFVHTSVTYDYRGFEVYNHTNLLFDKCSEYDFKDDVSYNKINKYYNSYEYCFNYTNSTVGGNNKNLNIFEFIQIRISTWNGNNWIDFSNNAYHDISVSLKTQQYYVDLNDLDNVLKPIYKDVNHISLATKSQFYHTEYLIERNEIKLEDNWWDIIFGSSTLTFNSLKFGRDRFTDEIITDKLDRGISFEVYLGDQTNQFRRKVSNLLEVAGVIGGILKLWDLFFGSFIGFLYTYMFKNEYK